MLYLAWTFAGSPRFRVSMLLSYCHGHARGKSALAPSRPSGSVVHQLLLARAGLPVIIASQYRTVTVIIIAQTYGQDAHPCAQIRSVIQEKTE